MTGKSNNMQGLIWTLLSGFGFTVYLVLAKIVTADFHPIMAAFFRAFFAVILLLPFIWPRRRILFKTRQPGLILLRSLFGTLGFVFSLLAFSSFYELPLAEFNAISFSRALFLTVIAALILRESVGPRRWVAVGIGFVGIVIMALPDLFTEGVSALSDATNMGAAMALASAFFFAWAIILVKYLTANHSTLALLTWANILSSVLLFVPLFYYWTTPTPLQWGAIFAMTASGTVAQFCYIKGMSLGDASFLAPFDYLRLPMAAAADLLIFTVVPGMNIWIGATIIISATLYITWREHVLSKSIADKA